MLYKRIKFIWRGLKARYRDHSVELKALISQINPGDVALDVGANKGSFTYSLSKAVGLEGAVYAFEPQGVLANYLRDMCPRQVLVTEEAMSDKQGESSFYAPNQGSSPGASLESKIASELDDWTSRVVKTNMLDFFLRKEKRAIKALKIDVEGHEFSVLKGAENIIDSHHPVIVIECEQRHLSTHKVEDVLSWLLDKGYEGWGVHRKTLISLNDFDIDIHQKNVGDRFWDKSDYINNFLFVWKRH